MSRYFQKGIPATMDDDTSKDDNDEDVRLEQYVLVEVADDDDDDDMVVIHSHDVALSSDGSSSPIESDDSTMKVLMIKDVAVVVTPAIAEKKVEDDCWEDDMMCVMDDDVLLDTQSKWKAFTLILLLMSLMIFEAGDLYVFLRDHPSIFSMSHATVGSISTSTCKGRKIVKCRIKYVPVAAPTEGKLLETSMMLVSNLDHSTETSSLSIDRVQQTCISNSIPAECPISSPNVPMRSLIPYSTPRRIEPTDHHIPSVPDYKDWIPTNNWTSVGTFNSYTFVNDLPVSDVQLDLRLPGRAKDEKNPASPVLPPSSPPERSMDLNEYSFHEFLNYHDHVLVIFFIPRPRFFTEFVPFWNNVTDDIMAEQLPVVTAMVDCYSHPHICRTQGCNRFPMIRWFHKGTVVVENYNRGRNVNKMLRFVKNTLKEIEERTANHRRDNAKQPSIPIVEPVSEPKLLLWHETGRVHEPKNDAHDSNDYWEEDENIKKIIEDLLMFHNFTIDFTDILYD